MCREDGSVGAQCIIGSHNSDVSEAHGLAYRLHDILDVKEDGRAGVEWGWEHRVVIL